MGNLSAWITSHVPWGVDTYNEKNIWDPDYTVAFLKLIGDFDDVVKEQLFAHTHIDNFRVAPTSWGVNSPNYMLASISPIYGAYPSFQAAKLKNDEHCISSFYDMRISLPTEPGQTAEWTTYETQETLGVPSGECLNVDA